MRVIGKHAESGVLEKYILPAADTTPAGERLGDEATGDKMRDRQRQRGVGTVERAGHRQVELAGWETSLERDDRGSMAALDQPERIVAALADTNDRHLQSSREAFEAFVTNRDDDGGSRALEERAEDALERGFVAIIVRVIPVEIHRHRDVGRERADRAVALVDLGYDPRRRRRGAGGRESRIAEEATEDVSKIGFRAGEGGDE